MTGKEREQAMQFLFATLVENSDISTPAARIELERKLMETAAAMSSESDQRVYRRDFEIRLRRLFRHIRPQGVSQ